MNLNSEPLNANNSPLTAPSMTTGTRGSDVMETTITGESSEETAAWQLVSNQNVAYECNKTGVALSVPLTTAQLQFNARDFYCDGYDSDGELGPFFDAVMDELSDTEDEEELPTAGGAPSILLLPTNALPSEQTQLPPPPPLLDEDAVKSMTVAQLKEELKKRKLAVNGVKQVLQDRLLGFLHNPNSNNLPSATPAAGGQNVTSAGFTEVAAWRDLKTEEVTVPEPNSNPDLVGPTVPAGEKEYQKRNFSETFDRPPFTAMSPVIEIGRNGKPVKKQEGRGTVDE
jgi:hypothetical protein